jgi:hypothetical protein
MSLRAQAKKTFIRRSRFYPQLESDDDPIKGNDSSFLFIRLSWHFGSSLNARLPSMVLKGCTR